MRGVLLIQRARRWTVSKRPWHRRTMVCTLLLCTAFAAAEENSPIGMRHLTAALRMETLKEGKLLMKSELGPYFDLAQPAAGAAPKGQEVKS